MRILSEVISDKINFRFFFCILKESYYKDQTHLTEIVVYNINKSTHQLTDPTLI